MEEYINTQLSSSSKEVDCKGVLDVVLTNQKCQSFFKILHYLTGEVSDSATSDSDDLDEEFDDGLDENMIGDDEDRARLEQMTEKEREQEIYNRIEKREVLKTRFEIEKKLKLAKKKEIRKKKEKEGDKPKVCVGLCFLIHIARIAVEPLFFSFLSSLLVVVILYYYWQYDYFFSFSFSFFVIDVILFFTFMMPLFIMNFHPFSQDLSLILFYLYHLQKQSANMSSYDLAYCNLNSMTILLFVGITVIYRVTQ